MPAKIARSAPRPPFRLPEGDGSGPNLASVLQEGWKNASIGASSIVICRSIGASAVKKKIPAHVEIAGPMAVGISS